MENPYERRKPRSPRATRLLDIDAWIDYGMITLRRDKQRLKCTWTNWEEGTIEGSPELIDELRPLLKQPPRA